MRVQQLYAHYNSQHIGACTNSHAHTLCLQKDEKDSLADSVRGDVVMQLLPLIDNFELARTQARGVRVYCALTHLVWVTKIVQFSVSVLDTTKTPCLNAAQKHQPP